MKPVDIKQYSSITLVVVFLSVSTSGCMVQQTPCENIVEVNRQIRECQQLKKDMHNKEHPQHALTARKRFETDCVNLRYYRDEYDTICKKNQTPITPVE